MKLKPILFFTLAALGIFSCKKADPAKALDVIGAEEPAPGTNPGGFTPFTTSTKTILASTSSTITNLIVSNNKLYLTGNFSSLGGATSRCIASYNGTSFVSEPNNLASGSFVYSVDNFNNNLLVGGIFSTTSGSGTKYFGYISPSGSTVNTAGLSVTGSVSTMGHYVNYCHIGGSVTSVSSSTAGGGFVSSSFALYSMPPFYSASPVTNAIQEFDNALFYGGSLGNSNEKNIVKYNNSNWLVAGGGFNNIVYDLEVYNGKLYAAGSMTNNGNGTSPLNYVNSLANQNALWQKTGGTTNLPTTCRKLAVHNNCLIASGYNISTGAGYLYCYNNVSDTWVNSSGAMQLYRLEKIVSFGGKLYGIERNTSTATSYFVRFD